MKLTLPLPSETQKRFFAERHRCVAFGGARGGGKSWAVRVKAVLLCERHPGIKVTPAFRDRRNGSYTQ